MCSLASRNGKAITLDRSALKCTTVVSCGCLLPSRHASRGRDRTLRIHLYVDAGPILAERSDKRRECIG